jgi:hypothetical protein
LTVKKNVLGMTAAIATEADPVPQRLGIDDRYAGAQSGEEEILCTPKSEHLEEVARGSTPP